MSLQVSCGRCDVQFSNGTHLSITPKSNISCCSGQILFLTGNNGCGKTTYLKALSGIYDVFTRYDARVSLEMQVSLDGSQVVMMPKVTPDISNGSYIRCGILPQSVRGNIFCKTVEQEIMFSLEHSPYVEGRSTTYLNESAKYLSIFGIGLEMQPHSLSKGEQQLVAFLSVLSTHPDVLVLDEPTATMDDHVVDWFCEKIMALLTDSKVHLAIITSQDSRLISRFSTFVGTKFCELESKKSVMSQSSYEQGFAMREWEPQSVKVNNLSITRGRADIYFEDLSLTAGHTLVVLGNNGSGKSTLMECIGGFIKPLTGSAIVADTNMFQFNSKLFRSLNSYAFQNAEEQICMINVRKEINLVPKSIRWLGVCLPLINSLGIDFEDVPWHLSFGQRKLIVYLSFLFSTPFMLIDEPFASLDKPNSALLIRVINEYVKAGGAALLSASRSHPELESLVNLSKLELKDHKGV